jgi:DhnA family fructose-bisphosphate aldolase class Ia
LNRLFDPRSRRCLAVAVDHGTPGEIDLLDGIDDMEAVVDALVEAGPDALLLAPGQAGLLQRRAGRARPALVLRVDVPDVYGREQPDAPTSTMLPEPVETAVRLDAACVVVNLLDVPGRPSLRAACVRNVMAVRAACDRAGMPLMVEPVPLAPGSAGYDVQRDARRLIGLVRQAVELGADVIKADPLSAPEDFARLVKVARVPLLIRGGGRIDERELLAVTEAVLSGGAAGLVYGRNVIQHADPPAMTRALMALVHEGATADAAQAVLA